jgi:hypothetical protein
LLPKQEVDRDGVCIYGYEQPLVDAFKATYGVDPHTLSNADENWIRFRASFLTDFMRELRPEARAKGISVSAKVRTMDSVQAPFPYWEPETAPTNSLRGSFVDWLTWVDEGLLDEVMLVHENFDLIALDPMKLLTETRAAKQLIGGKAKLMMAVWCYNTTDAPVVAGKRALDHAINAAMQGGADGVVLWETTPVHSWGGALGGGGGTDFGLWSVVKELAHQRTAQIMT